MRPQVVGDDDGDEEDEDDQRCQALQLEALIGWAWRKTDLRMSDQVRRWSWIAVVALAIAALAGGALVWNSWQNEARDLVDPRTPQFPRI